MKRKLLEPCIRTVGTQYRVQIPLEFAVKYKLNSGEEIVIGDDGKGVTIRRK